MNILGITHQASYNPAACILVDGKLIAFAEEERFVRVKHALRYIPEKAIDFCLREARLKPEDINVVAIGWEKPPRTYFGLDLIRNTLKSTGHSFAPKWWRNEATYWTYIRFLDLDLEAYLKKFRNVKKATYYSHHLAHAASAIFPSSFDSGNFITLDNRGGFESGLVGCFHKDEIEILARIPISSSVGAMYENVTEILGFQPHSHEGKVMALGSYGKEMKERFCSYKRDFKIRVSWNLIRHAKELVDKESGNDPTKDIRADIAATVQRNLEAVCLELLEDLKSRTSYDKLVLAGGTFLNANTNGRIIDSGLVEEAFIQPASNDAGVALGAAILAARESGDRIKVEFKHAYWGPSYSNEEIEGMLTNWKVKYEYNEDIEGVVAESLAKGNIVGWLRGRMEIGPRALGGRSILADPSNPKMKDTINYKVKQREWWRPFAPSMLEEHTSRYLPNLRHAPFMIVTSKVNKEHLDEIISAAHIDETCRPQTVEKETCASYYKLIDDFRGITGIPAILNTSFNFRGEPLVCDPRDALRTFVSTGMDCLALENFLIRKQ